MYYFLDIYKPFFSKNNTYCVANNIYNIYKTFANPIRLERDEFNKPFPLFVICFGHHYHTSLF